MKEYLPFVLIGLTNGAIYALAAMGLVVTYTTSGVFNFAHGTIAMVSAYLYYTVRVDWGVTTVLAVPLVVLVAGPLIGLVVDKLLFRRLQGAPSAAYVVVSIGLLVLLQGLVIVGYGPTARQVPAIFPSGHVKVGTTFLGYDQISVFLISAALALALALFFKRTQTGLEMRAVVDDPQLAELTGADAPKVTGLAWMLGTTFAALAGVLLCPTLGVDVTLLTLLVVQAFGAAAVGKLTSLPLAYGGALGLGIAQQLVTKEAAAHSENHPWLNGLGSSLPFIVLFAVLVFSRKGSFKELTKSVQPRSKIATGKAVRFPLPLLAGLALVAVIIPSIASNSRLTTATTALLMIVVFSSLSLLVGMSRQISLCHAVFLILGATTLGHLQADGVPYLLALLIAGLVVVPIAGLLAIPAVRLAGLFLALATFGFGVLVQNLLFETPFLFGTHGSVRLRSASVFGHSFDHTKSLYFFVLVLAMICLIAIETLRSTRLGRLMRGVADSSVAVETLGINTTSARAIVFCASGFFCAIAGGLLATQTQEISTLSFSYVDSLTFVAVLVTAGSRTLGGSILAAVLLTVLPAFITSANFLNYQTIAFGVFAILLAQTNNGIVGLFSGVGSRLRLPDAGAGPPDASRSGRTAAWSGRLAERTIDPREPVFAPGRTHATREREFVG